jgi:ABC-type cobalamin/Fe3+-siderophores transport system ATPase subunit
MITLHNIDFGYTKKQHLFKELSLEMQKGHIYGLLGKNGSGKTSLLKIMAGLRFPQQGSTEVLGHRAAFPIGRDLYTNVKNKTVGAGLCVVLSSFQTGRIPSLFGGIRR